nr:MAG TPA: hypothetical protein [Caudoviricetes sp.]
MCRAIKAQKEGSYRMEDKENFSSPIMCVIALFINDFSECSE